jgi:hypothetical protein
VKPLKPDASQRLGSAEASVARWDSVRLVVSLSPLLEKSVSKGPYSGVNRLFMSIAVCCAVLGSYPSHALEARYWLFW